MLPNQRSNFRRARFTTLGLRLHLDASLPATVIRDGSNFVSAWNDKSGAQRHMVQATQANKPVFQATGLGGLGALQFDGSDDFMTFSDQTLAYIAGRSFTIFYVASKPANNNTYIIGGTATGTRTNLFAGNLTAKDVTEAITKGKDKATLTAVGGGKITASIVGGKVILTDEKGGNSTITTTDLKATNGVIHVINTVLLPK